MFFKISFVKKYFALFFILTAIAALAYAGGGETVSFPRPLESYGDAEILQKNGVKAGPILQPDDLLSDPQLLHREFIIETVDSKTKLKFRQVYYDNMSKMTNPKITKYEKETYTKISFIPDFKRFKLEKLTSDIMNLFENRANLIVIFFFYIYNIFIFSFFYIINIKFIFIFIFIISIIIIMVFPK